MYKKIGGITQTTCVGVVEVESGNGSRRGRSWRGPGKYIADCQRIGPGPRVPVKMGDLLEVPADSSPGCRLRRGGLFALKQNREYYRGLKACSAPCKTQGIEQACKEMFGGLGEGLGPLTCFDGKVGVVLVLIPGS